MIQPMKKVALLALESEKKQVLEDLRDLAVMHVTVDRSALGRGDAAECAKTLEKIIQANVLLEEAAKTKVSQVKMPPADCLRRIGNLLEELAAERKKRESLEGRREQLLPWGSFRREQLGELAEKGVSVKFLTCPKKKIPAAPEGAVLVPVSSDSQFEYVVQISRSETAVPAGAEQVKMPDVSLAEAEAGIAAAEKRIGELHAELASYVCNRKALAEYAETVREKLDFATASLSMSEKDRISVLRGYVPSIRMDSLRETAHRKGWALLFEDPAPDDDQVPTYITKPRWLGIMDPLFDFIGVDPGYRENDVNVFFLVFFPIFFGMIIGDAGYAVLFLAIVFLCKYLFRNVEKARLPLNLFVLLSCCSLIWGWLNGSWFGLPEGVLPEWMRGWSFLAEPRESALANELVRRTGLLHDGMTEAQIDGVWNGLNNRIVQWFCFFLAALHLSSARIFKFFAEIRRSWLAAGHLGWACLIVANFLMAVSLIVFPGTFPKQIGYPLYIAGFVLVVVTIRGDAALNLPFSLIGSFTDVLSYIRLFAVGLAGTLIAEKFNGMGLMILDGKTGTGYVLAMIALIAIAVFGHLLNIALGFLSVLVHAIRLNTLEFSNHMEMQWAGIRYRPFAGKTKTRIQK